MVNTLKLHILIVLGFLCFLKAGCSEFREIYRNTFFFINDSDQVCSVDISGLKNARFFRTTYEGEITKPTLIVHPGKYRYASLRYISGNLELGHVLFYGTDITQYEMSINTDEKKKELEHWLIGSLDLVILEGQKWWSILLNNNYLAKFAVNEEIGLAIERQRSEGVFVIKFMNILPEYRYTNRRTPPDFTSLLTGEEYPMEEPEDGDTRPLYLGPGLYWPVIKEMYEPEKEEREGGCCTIQ